MVREVSLDPSHDKFYDSYILLQNDAFFGCTFFGCILIFNKRNPLVLLAVKYHFLLRFLCFLTIYIVPYFVLLYILFSGNLQLAEQSLPRAAQPNEVPPPLRISQRMKLEPSQLEGVETRIQV